jgi:hypothetical protein
LYVGLPDGRFSDQNCQYWYIFGGLGIEHFWFISCPFGIFIAILVYFVAIWHFIAILPT